MSSKKCFSCGISKSLDKFYLNRRKHKLASDLGVTVVCKDCDLLKAIRTLSNVRFDFQTEKFVVNKFENEEQVVKWYRENEQL